MMSPSRWLFGGLLMSLLAPACCCDEGPDRLLRVDIDDERGALRQEVDFDGSVNDFPINAFFQPYLVGGPGPGKLTTEPMLELYDSEGERVSLQRFTASNEGGCADTEIYEPVEDELVLGESYALVHRSSVSPGNIDDSGSPERSLRDVITKYEGERALVAEILVVEPTSYPSGLGGGGGAAGAGGGGGAAGAGGTTN